MAAQVESINDKQNMRHLILSLIFILSCVLSLQAQTMEDGINYCKSGYYDNAIATLEKSLNNSDTNKGSAYYYLGLSELGRGDSQKAQAYFSKCIENAGDSPIESLLASGALALINSDAKATDGYFKKAEKQDKGSISVLREIGRLYVLADSFKYSKEIDTLLAKCMKKGGEGQWAYNLIKGDLSGEPSEAAGHYEMAMESAGDSNSMIEPTVKYARLFEDVSPEYSISKYQEYRVYDPTAFNIVDVLYPKLLMKVGKYSEALRVVGNSVRNPKASEEVKRIFEEVVSKMKD